MQGQRFVPRLSRAAPGRTPDLRREVVATSVVGHEDLERVFDPSARSIRSRKSLALPARRRSRFLGIDKSRRWSSGASNVSDSDKGRRLCFHRSIAETAGSAPGRALCHPLVSLSGKRGCVLLHGLGPSCRGSETTLRPKSAVRRGAIAVWGRASPRCGRTVRVHPGSLPAHQNKWARRSTPRSHRLENRALARASGSNCETHPPKPTKTRA